MNNPKRIYIRKIDGGRKISVGEYIRARWSNIINPFKVDDESSKLILKGNINQFKTKSGREVVAVLKNNDKDIQELLKYLDIKSEF